VYVGVLVFWAVGFGGGGLFCYGCVGCWWGFFVGGGWVFFCLWVVGWGFVVVFWFLVFIGKFFLFFFLFVLPVQLELTC